MEKGKFFVLEGIDGCGKSSQAPILAKRLREHGLQVYETGEPTNSPIGGLIRGVLTGSAKSDNRVLAALFAADRLGHLLEEPDGLLKKISDGVTVVSDRYYFSSYAYHSVDAPMEWVIASNSLSAELLRPTLTVFIDIDPGEAIRRIKKGRSDFELFEKLDRLALVRGYYLEAFEKLRDKEKVAFVDGSKSPVEVAEDIWRAVSAVL